MQFPISIQWRCVGGGISLISSTLSWTYTSVIWVGCLGHWVSWGLGFLITLNKAQQIYVVYIFNNSKNLALDIFYGLQHWAILHPITLKGYQLEDGNNCNKGNQSRDPLTYKLLLQWAKSCTCFYHCRSLVCMERFEFKHNALYCQYMLVFMYLSSLFHLLIDYNWRQMLVYYCIFVVYHRAWSLITINKMCWVCH